MFGLCQIHAFIDYLRSKLSRSQFETLFWSLAVLVTSAVLVVGGALTFMGSESLGTIWPASINDLSLCPDSSPLFQPMQKSLLGLVVSTPCWTLHMLRTTFPS